MGRHFAPSFKAKMVRRMVGANGVSATQLSIETGIDQQTLSRWLREAHTIFDVKKKKSKNPSKKASRTVADKARILMEAAKLEGNELIDYLEREEATLAELEQWRMALDDDGKAFTATTKRIRKLELEILRKDKALAETAALLVLQKKARALWAAEDDDTDEENDK
jgi:transposase-like protein